MCDNLGRDADPDVACHSEVHYQLRLEDTRNRYLARMFTAQHTVDHPRHVPHCRSETRAIGKKRCAFCAIPGE